MKRIQNKSSTRHSEPVMLTGKRNKTPKNGVTMRRNFFSKTRQNAMTNARKSNENGVILIPMSNREKDLIFSKRPKRASGLLLPLRKLSKSIAAFFLVSILGSLAAPNIAYALTSGPTAPEYTGFSSFDASGIVNHLTGDISYSVPLMEVPSSNGSFPFSMSYNSGIKLNQEASWVGLGWDLNPGAITRSVSGFPDDFSGQILEVHDEWEGGYAYTEGAGIPLRIAGLWIEKSWGTHLPTHIGSAGSFLHFGWDDRGRKGGGPLFPSFKWVDALLHDQDTTAAVGIAIKGLIDTFDSNVIDDINSIGGIPPIARHDEGKSFSTEVQTHEMYNISNFVYRKTMTRYWIDDVENTKMIGALNGYYADPDDEESAYDRYIMGEVITEPSIEDNPINIRDNAEVMAGPSFSAYDNYSVSSSGLVGNFTPYALENASLYSRKKSDIQVGLGTKVDIDYVKHKHHTKDKVPFKFFGEFSNTFKVDNVSNFSLGESPSSTTIDFGTNGLGYTPHYVPDLYLSDEMKLKTAHHINSYSNDEILNGVSSTISNYVRGVNRTIYGSFIISYTIGGFSITKPNGLTYHFVLPAYTYENGEYFEKTDWADAKISRRTSKDAPYPYSWLLTSITGSDYVDRNNNNVCDDEDWGYWMNFVYGRTTDKYKYRFPYEDSQTLIDDDGSFLYEEGFKDLYYLDAIYSDTHTAIFSKNISREDGKGYNGNYSSSLEDIYLFDNSSFSRSPLDEINYISNLYSTDYNSGDISLYHANVISTEDLEQYLSGNDEKIQRQVSFNYSYELAPHTSNSSDGKLTLKELSFLGKTGKDIMPPIVFEYDIEENSAGTLEGGILTPMPVIGSDPLGDVGDILEVTYSDGKTGYHYISGKTSSYLVLESLYNGRSPSLEDVQYRVTRNPPYVPGHYDSWGYFKPDYVNHIKSNDSHQNDLDRIVTDVSSVGSTSWNIRSITFPLGKKVSFEFESDEYESIGVGNPMILNCKNEMGFFFDNAPETEWITQGHPNEWEGGHAEKIKIYIVEEEVEKLLANNIEVGDYIDIVTYISQEDADGDLLNSMDFDDNTYIKPLEGELLIEEIGDDYILVTDPNAIFIDFSNTNGSAVYHWHYFSYLKIPFEKKMGGGVRISSVKVEDAFQNLDIEKNFEYYQGSTSYEPIGFNGLFIDPDMARWTRPASNSYIEYFQRVYQKEFSRLMHISEELPPPSVMYGQVIESQYYNGEKYPAETKYEFYPFDDSMLDVEELDYQVIPTDGGSHESRTIKITNKTSLVGKMKSISRLGVDGKMISKSEYRYADQEELQRFDDQGVFEEVAHEHRVVTRLSNDQKINHATVSIRSHIPSPLIKTTAVNFKNDQSLDVSVIGFDLLSGHTTHTYSEDDHGNKLVTKEIPGYKIFPEMGHKNDGGSHMLTQNGERFIYLMNDQFDPDSFSYGNEIMLEADGLIGASVSLWSDETEVLGATNTEQEGIWRKRAMLSFIGDPEVTPLENGLYPVASFNENPVDWKTLGTSDALITNVPSGWQKNSEITLYDVNSHALEATDVNGNYAATQFDVNNERVLATIANSEYEQFAYTGFETPVSYGESITINIEKGDGDFVGPDASLAHTGEYCLNLSTEYNGIECLIPDVGTHSSYLLSVWSTDPDLDIYYGRSTAYPGTLLNHPPGKQVGDGEWYLIEAIIPSGGGGVLNVTFEGGSMRLDDFRLHPIDATMTSYVYNEWGELSDILDANNLFTHYEYDEMGRLKSITRETLSHGPVKVSETAINYGR